MRIGFYLTEGSTLGYVLADLMVSSVRKCMPGMEIVQFTDEKSAGLYGVEVRRLDSPRGPRQRLEHYASVEGEWVFIDTDCVVQGDLSGAFSLPFDVAVADRRGSMLPGETGSPFMTRMPYNLGIVFSRSGKFWADALKHARELPEKDRQELWADQLAVCNLIRDGKYSVKVLDGMFWNFSPQKVDDDLEGKLVVHYKGKRKGWMLNRFYREAGL